MIKNAVIYVSTTASLLQKMNINWCRGNGQYYMLAHPDINYNSIDTYKLEILPIFMLSVFVYINCSLN